MIVQGTGRILSISTSLGYGGFLSKVFKKPPNVTQLRIRLHRIPEAAEVFHRLQHALTILSQLELTRSVFIQLQWNLIREFTASCQVKTFHIGYSSLIRSDMHNVVKTTRLPA